MALREPEERERLGYDLGFPSRPNLVARSSTTRWSQRREWPARKKLDIATGHKIQQPWNDPNGPLQEAIIGALAGIDWTAIDILRIGWEDYSDYSYPKAEVVTMLISVSENSTSFPRAEAAISACRDILVRFDLDDVEVEMKESIFMTCASIPAASNTSAGVSDPTSATQIPASGQETARLHPGPFKEDIVDMKYKILRDMSEYIGTSLDASQAPPGKNSEGTKCVYLHDSNGKAYALTCRHNLLPENDVEGYRREEGQMASTRDVIQPGRKALEKAVKYFTDMTELFVMSDEPSDRHRHDLLQSCKPYVEQFQTKGSATIGHIEFSPPIEVQSFRLRDWALVELSQKGFSTKVSELRNKIPITIMLPIMMNAINVFPTERGPPLGFEAYPEVKIGPSIIPESELDGAIPRDPYGNKGLYVLKHGAKTGFTIGITNGVQSLVRHPAKKTGESSVEVISHEKCVIGITERDRTFAKIGDSGACVFDCEGRIHGMIVGGVTAPDAWRGCYDVTYVTPMQWLLDDIKKHGYDVQLPK